MSCPLSLQQRWSIVFIWPKVFGHLFIVTHTCSHHNYHYQTITFLCHNYTFLLSSSPSMCVIDSTHVLSSFSSAAMVNCIHLAKSVWPSFHSHSYMFSP